jgi:hypothetical protein
MRHRKAVAFVNDADFDNADVVEGEDYDVSSVGEFDFNGSGFAFFSTTILCAQYHKNVLKHEETSLNSGIPELFNDFKHELLTLILMSILSIF